MPAHGKAGKQVQAVVPDGLMKGSSLIEGAGKSFGRRFSVDVLRRISRATSKTDFSPIGSGSTYRALWVLAATSEPHLISGPDVRAGIFFIEGASTFAGAR